MDVFLESLLHDLIVVKAMLQLPVLCWLPDGNQVLQLLLSVEFNGTESLAPANETCLGQHLGELFWGLLKFLLEPSPYEVLLLHVIHLPLPVPDILHNVFLQTAGTGARLTACELCLTHWILICYLSVTDDYW